ncbi:hypothetical protein JCM1841_002394 [Sporobolomyces salmonicolor]
MPRTLYTSGYGGEIAVLSFDAVRSSLSVASTIPAGTAPTWLTLSTIHPILYTGDEFNSPSGTLIAFSIAEDGSLAQAGESAEVGEGPVHFALGKGGKHLYAACYSGGELTAVGLKDDGTFDTEREKQSFKYRGKGQHKGRQEAPHAHGVAIDPTGNFLFCADLGTDQLHVYKIGPQLTEQPAISLPAGNGPRHLVFAAPSSSSSRTLLYLVEELSNTVAIFEVLYPSSPDGTLSLNVLQREVSTLPPDYKDVPGDWTAAELDVSPDRRFLYVSNRAPTDPAPKSDTLMIAELSADGIVVEGRTPTFVSLGGRGPRHFTFSPKTEEDEEGKYLAVAFQRTNEVVVYVVKGKGLAEVARVKGIKEPTCVVWR